jgi:peptidoglycan/xylan/chitin deacetylase (PgdA/CDA1 family)
MKSAYLTIDDAPGKDFIAKMEYLHQQGIPVLFFCIGNLMQENELAVRAAIERGFIIGNHSFSHPFFSALSIEDCRREILQTDQIIEKLYHDAGVQRPAKYFRFPYLDSGGDKHAALQQYLHELGYRQPAFEGINLQYSSDPSLLQRADVLCTFDQAEYWYQQADAPWGLSAADAILARIDEDVPYGGRALNREDTVDIILLHDHDKTTELFFQIVARYIKKGIQFVPIPLN